MKTTELTVQLPEAEAHTLELYAREHSVSVGELLARFARRLRNSRSSPHPANLQFTGTIPTEVDARAEHRQHVERKHQ